MKAQTQYLKLILAASLVVQFGCSGPNRSNGQQQLYSLAGTTAQDQSIAGNAFRTGSTTPYATNNNNGWMQQAAATVFGSPDTDKDGVADTLDKCANTLAGTRVGSDGCELATGSGADKGAGSEPANEAPPATFNVSEETTDWATECPDQNKGIDTDADGIGEDTDGDGIKDTCEIALKDKYIGLDKDVFNGALVSGVKFQKKDAKLVGDESKNWKKAKAVAGVGKSSNGIDGYFDRNIMKKFLALSFEKQSDMKAMKALYELKKSDASSYLRVNGDMKDRGSETLQSTIKDKQIVLVKQNEYERIPFALQEDSLSVSNLTGMSTNTISYLDQQELLYLAEFYLVIPSAENGVKLRVGNLVNTNEASVGSKAGMFYVMTNNNSVIMTSDLISDKLRNKDDLFKNSGMVPSSSKCETVHVVIAYLADTEKLKKESFFSENVFMYDEAEDVYKHIPQEMLRTQPLGGDKCNEETDSIVLADVASEISVAKVKP